MYIFLYLSRCIQISRLLSQLSTLYFMKSFLTYHTCKVYFVEDGYTKRVISLLLFKLRCTRNKVCILDFNGIFRMLDNLLFRCFWQCWKNCQELYEARFPFNENFVLIHKFFFQFMLAVQNCNRKMILFYLFQLHHEITCLFRIPFPGC